MNVIENSSTDHDIFIPGIICSKHITGIFHIMNCVYCFDALNPENWMFVYYVHGKYDLENEYNKSM